MLRSWDEDVPIAGLTFDARMQTRAKDELDEEHVEQMRPWLDLLPRVKVFRIQEARRTVDVPVGGMHRIEAFTREDRETVPARVYEGTWADALYAAIGENKDHGLRRTPADVRRAVWIALAARRSKEFEWTTDATLAEHIGVSKQRFSDLRKEWEEEQKEEEKSPESGAGQEDEEDSETEKESAEPLAVVPPDLARARKEAEDFAADMRTRAEKRPDDYKNDLIGVKIELGEAIEDTVRLATILAELDGDPKPVKKAEAALLSLWERKKDAVTAAGADAAARVG